MKKVLRKFLGFFVALVLCISPVTLFVGCGEDTEVPETVQPNEQQVQPTDTTKLTDADYKAAAVSSGATLLDIFGSYYNIEAQGTAGSDFGSTLLKIYGIADRDGAVTQGEVNDYRLSYTSNAFDYSSYFNSQNFLMGYYMRLAAQYAYMFYDTSIINSTYSAGFVEDLAQTYKVNTSNKKSVDFNQIYTDSSINTLSGTIKSLYPVSSSYNGVQYYSSNAESEMYNNVYFYKASTDGNKIILNVLVNEMVNLTGVDIAGVGLTYFGFPSFASQMTIDYDFTNKCIKSVNFFTYRLRMKYYEENDNKTLLEDLATVESLNIDLTKNTFSFSSYGYKALNNKYQESSDYSIINNPFLTISGIKNIYNYLFTNFNVPGTIINMISSSGCNIYHIDGSVNKTSSDFYGFIPNLNSEVEFGKGEVAAALSVPNTPAQIEASKTKILSLVHSIEYADVDNLFLSGRYSKDTTTVTSTIKSNRFVQDSYIFLHELHYRNGMVFVEPKAVSSNSTTTLSQAMVNGASLLQEAFLDVTSPSLSSMSGTLSNSLRNVSSAGQIYFSDAYDNYSDVTKEFTRSKYLRLSALIKVAFATEKELDANLVKQIEENYGQELFNESGKKSSIAFNKLYHDTITATTYTSIFDDLKLLQAYEDTQQFYYATYSEDGSQIKFVLFNIKAGQLLNVEVVAVGANTATGNARMVAVTTLTPITVESQVNWMVESFRVTRFEEMFVTYSTALYTSTDAARNDTTNFANISETINLVSQMINSDSEQATNSTLPNYTSEVYLIGYKKDLEGNKQVAMASASDYVTINDTSFFSNIPYSVQILPVSGAEVLSHEYFTPDLLSFGDSLIINYLADEVEYGDDVIESSQEINALCYYISSLEG